jgi:hypothetical protein
LLWHCAQKVRCSDLIKDTEQEDMNKLINMNLINSNHDVTDKGMVIINDCEKIVKKIKVKEVSGKLGDDYISQVRLYRSKFPPGKKADEASVTDKAFQFLDKYPDYDWDIIQKATDLYLSEQQNPVYIMKAGNFIQKREGGLIGYPIQEYCDRIISGEETREVIMFD